MLDPMRHNLMLLTTKNKMTKKATMNQCLGAELENSTVITTNALAHTPRHEVLIIYDQSNKNDYMLLGSSQQ